MVNARDVSKSRGYTGQGLIYQSQGHVDEFSFVHKILYEETTATHVHTALVTIFQVNLG